MAHKTRILAMIVIRTAALAIGLLAVIQASAHAGSCDSARAVLKRDPLVEILWDNTLTSVIPSLDGGLAVDCGEGVSTGLVVYSNRHDPGDAFIRYAADLAHRLTGVSSDEALRLMRKCLANLYRRQAEDPKIVGGPTIDPIDIKNRIHVDCTAKAENSGFYIFNRSGLDD
jgi:hypothetical protein